MTQPSWFIAFDALLRLQGADPPPKVRLLHPRDHHLTVAFLGNAGPERAAKAWTVLEGHLPSSFVVKTGVCRWFGGRTPRAISCQVTDRALARWVEKTRALLLRAAHCDLDEREVQLHVTVARIKHRASNEERIAAEQWMKNLNIDAEISLSRIALYTWAEPHTPGQPRYQRVYTAELS